MKGPCVLEMPTGTGKTVSLLSLITSYQAQYEQTGKLIYCCRTVGEVEKTMEELRRVIQVIHNQIMKFFYSSPGNQSVEHVNDIEQ